MKRLILGKHKDTCFVPEADTEEEIVVLRNPEIVRRSLVKKLLFVWVSPKPLPEADIIACHKGKVLLYHASTALTLKDYFTQTID